MCILTGLTRDAAANEPFVWLETLAKAAAQERAVSALYQMEATLAAVAPGALKDGASTMRKIRERFQKEAGF